MTTERLILAGPEINGLCRSHDRTAADCEQFPETPQLLVWNGDDPPSLGEAKEVLNGAFITCMELPDGRQLLCDEEGMLRKQRANPDATFFVLAIDQNHGTNLFQRFGEGPVLGPCLLLPEEVRWE